MAYGTVNADTLVTSTSGGILGAGNASIMKNRIINGAMVIDQRNAGASVSIQSSTGYTLDRWNTASSQNSKFSVQQNAGSVTTPAGFTNYLGVTSSSAYTVGSSELFTISQPIEAFNTADLAWGTANAKTVTVSFQVYSSLTGTFGGALRNATGSRCYPFSYSIASANTWTSISVTIAGDTSGTWAGSTNGIGIYLSIGLGVGSTLSGTAGSWSSPSGAGYFSSTGAVSVVGTNGATFYITGVQLEVGSSATGFEYRQYGQELALCQRYYEKSFNTSVAPAQNVGSNLYEICCSAVIASTGQARFLVKYLVTKRITPATITTYNPSAANAQARDLNAVADCTTTNATYSSDNFMLIQATQPSGTSVGNRIAVNWSVDAEL